MDLSDKVGISIGLIIVALLAAAVIGKLVAWWLLLIMAFAVAIFAALRWYAAVRAASWGAAVSAVQAVKNDLVKAVRGEAQ